MSTAWTQLFGEKASIYSLENDSKQWIERGTKGTIHIYINQSNQNDVRLRWHKLSTQIYWKLINAKLKPKGDRAFILKAVCVEDDKDEIIAIRFADQNIANQFSTIFTQIHPNPMLTEPDILNKWHCSQCTYDNNMDTSRCIICNAEQNASQQLISTQKPISTPIQPLESFHMINKWKCGMCTFSNDNNTIKCGMCGLLKESSISNVSDNQDVPKWICVSCTYENDIASKVCLLCSLSATQSLKAHNVNQVLPENASNAIMIKESEFKRVLCLIITLNGDPSPLLNTLKSVTNKLTKNDVRYRTLDTTNPKVEARLIGYRGALDFLYLLGFKEDTMGKKLICLQKPSINVIKNAMKALILYQLKFGVGKCIITDEEDIKYKELNKQILELDEIVVFGYIHKYNLFDINIPNQLIQLIALFYYDKILSLRTIEKNNIDDVLGYDTDNEHLLSLQEIIEWATNNDAVNHETIKTIIITHKSFTDSITLLKCLKRVFIESKSSKRNTLKIRINILKSLELWMIMYLKQDFMENNELKNELKGWLTEELLNEEYKEPLLTELISSISIHFNSLKCEPLWLYMDCIKNNNNKQKGDDTWIDDQKRMESKLLIYGYIRNMYKQNLLNIVTPTELIELFCLFYHENIKVPQKFKLSYFVSDDIADQITLIDEYMFKKTEMREFLNQNWRNKENEKVAPNILKLIQHFNLFTIFIQIEILKQQSVRNRVKSIKRIIKMGQRFREIRNYNSLCAVFSALNSAPIHRLKLSWKRVSEKYLKMFDEFKTIFSRDFGHRNLRKLLKCAKAPCIPHIGICLQELLFIDDGNNRLRTNWIDFNNLNTQNLHFNKLVKMVEIIKNIKSYHCCDYNIKQKLFIQKMILIEFEKLSDITEDQIWNISTEIKKKDEIEY